MAKRQEGVAIKSIEIKNLADGTRDYPLKDGSSIFLPPAGKGVKFPSIAEDDISEALLLAKKKGLVEFIPVDSIQLKEVSE